MAEPATAVMSATEFCTWEGGTDTRYELIDGIRWHAGLPLIGQATFASRCLGRGIDLDALYDLTNL